MLTIKNLENCFNTASKNNFEYVGVLISMPGCNKPELIINEKENFEYKLDYYKNAYDERLKHKHSNGIKIIGFTFGNSLSEIEVQLIRPSDNFGIDTAMEYIKAGRVISRHNWNGKGLTLGLAVPDGNTKINVPYVYMKTVDDKIVPWCPSQTDILSKDFYLINRRSK